MRRLHLLPLFARSVVFQSLVLVPLSFYACKDEVMPPPPSHVSTVQLSVEDVAVTEVWLRLRFTDAAQPRSYALRRDNVLIATGTLTGADTLLADTTTSPGYTYSYKGLRLTGTSPTDSSSALQVTTLDTTSHVFTQVRIDTLGDGNSSALYDVAIISDTLVYAVGEIYLRDSTGQFDPQPYNLAVWNGQNWRLQKLYYQGFPPVIRSIFAVSSHEVWLDPWFHWDGQGFQEISIDPIFYGVGVKKMWGNSSGLYVVGYNGFIAHYNGSAWARLESGTQVSINDIWGVVDQATGKRTILCVATNHLQGGEHKLLSISEAGTVDSLPWVSQKEIYSLWMQSQKRLYTAGEGLFVRQPNNQWKEYTATPRIYTYRIRGVRQNDIVVTGGFGLVLHWNGVSFHEYPEAAAALSFACAYDGNLIVAVGYTATRAVVVQMRR